MGPSVHLSATADAVRTALSLPSSAFSLRLAHSAQPADICLEATSSEKSLGPVVPSTPLTPILIPSPVPLTIPQLQEDSDCVPSITGPLPSTRKPVLSKTEWTGHEWAVW